MFLTGEGGTSNYYAYVLIITRIQNSLVSNTYCWSCKIFSSRPWGSRPTQSLAGSGGRNFSSGGVELRVCVGEESSVAFI
jgi:hypothetical protein